MQIFWKSMRNTLLAVLLFFTLFPFYLMIVNSFKWANEITQNPWFFSGVFHLTNYSKAFLSILRPLLNSAIVAFCVIGITILVSLLASYAFIRFTFAGKNLLYFGIIALLMIPGFVLLIPQYIQIIQLGVPDSYIALIMPPAAYSVAMGTLLIRSSLASLPRSLFEAADMEGAGEMIILGRIVAPLSGPILATVAIITGLASWNNYIWPLVASSSLSTRQITVALTLLKGSIREGQGLLLAGYVIGSFPIIVLFCFSSRAFIAGLTQGSVKG